MSWILDTIVSRLVPNQGGALWLGLVVSFLVFGDFNSLRSRRNVVLCGLLLVAPLMVGVIDWHGRAAVLVFTLIYFATAGYTLWALRLGLRGSSLAWTPNPGRTGLLVLLAAVLFINAVVVFGRPPDDAGYYTNLGGLRWTETGVLPYADPELKGPDSPAHGAAATYGPLLYAAHLPFQLALGTHRNPAELSPQDPSYVRPPNLATQLACFTFHLLGLFALFRVLEPMAGVKAAIGAVVLYAGSPYVLGLGGEKFLAGGLVYISHIAPAAMTLLAFLSLHRPFVSGALLAAGAGLLYYPAFFFPLWLGWFTWRRAGAVRFAAGFVLVGLLITLLVVAFTPAPPGENAVSLFLESTVEHQEGVGSDEYGLSEFGFWGNHPWLASFWHAPLFGSGSLFKPAFLVYAALCMAAFFLARGGDRPALAAFTAMLAAGIQLWKSHAAGTYVEWYYPFLLIALIGGGAALTRRRGTVAE